MTDAVKDAVRRTPQEILHDRCCTDEELLSLSSDDLIRLAEAILNPPDPHEALNASGGDSLTRLGDD